MFDEPERQPSPNGRPVRDRHQVDRLGLVSWDDVVLPGGRETPEPEPPDSDLDVYFRRNVPPGRTGAARSGHRTTGQETAPAPEHYPADNQDARTPPGSDAIGDLQPVGPLSVQGVPLTMAATGAQDPAPPCNICGDPGHAQDGCTVDQATLLCDICNGVGHWSARPQTQVQGANLSP